MYRRISFFNKKGFLHKRDNFSKEEILEIFEYMWSVVMADGKIDDFEAALMSKLVGLFHLTGKESAEAKKKAMSHQ